LRTIEVALQLLMMPDLLHPYVAAFPWLSLLYGHWLQSSQETKARQKTNAILRKGRRNRWRSVEGGPCLHQETDERRSAIIDG
jgi:hypothetical protein